MELQEKHGFKVSDGGAYYLNEKSQKILDQMKEKNTSLSKKLRSTRLVIKATPFAAFFIAYPIGGLVSSILQKPVEDVFYMVAPVVAILLYASLKRLTGIQDSIIEEMGSTVDLAVEDTQHIAYGEKAEKDKEEIENPHL